jgi:DNA-binding transcriptional MocR family regulator
MLTLPEGMDAVTLLARAQARGVTFTPGNAFFVDGGGEGRLRLSFSSLALAQVSEGVRRLAEAIREQARQPGRAVREPALAVPLV